jgi:phasin family protein
MELLRCTKGRRHKVQQPAHGTGRTKATRLENDMTPISNPFADLGRQALEAAALATRISLDSAERAITVQLEYAKGSLEQATLNARAVSQAKDVNELVSLRARIAENALENVMGYSRSLYDVASEAQAEYSRLAEERMSSFQQAVTAGVDQAAKAAPGGSDVTVAAIKSQLAATTAAFDTFTKAARNFASFADASVKSAASKPRK